MKKILFLILTFITSNIYAEWSLIVTNESSDIYVKTDSIKRKGHIVSYWELLNYKSIKNFKDKQYSSVKMKSELDCNMEVSKTTFMALYSDFNGSGEPVASFKTGENFSEIIPETEGHKIYKFVCKKR